MKKLIVGLVVLAGLLMIPMEANACDRDCWYPGKNLIKLFGGGCQVNFHASISSCSSFGSKCVQPSGQNTIPCANGTCPQSMTTLPGTPSGYIIPAGLKTPNVYYQTFITSGSNPAVSVQSSCPNGNCQQGSRR